ncbi:MAG TPA: heat-inducible transcriptional repressor HrcA [Acidimicrobiia bacterium]|nr:heat-inducible transcriptional repressor HrcA [Acidimicrobiia bacterium]
MLEDRRSEILRALVEEHIRSGEPVSSRAIVERAHLAVSTATVRNDLAALESEGFVIQPHTSAGRVPTAAAYRYYVDHLGPGRLRATAQAKIDSFFGDVHLELSKLLKETSDLLAEVTDLPSVVVAPTLRNDRVRAMHSVQVTADQLLLIVVTDGGRVLQQRARVRVPITPGDLEEAHRMMSAAVVGTNLGAEPMLSDEVLGRLEEPIREAVLTMNDGLHLAATTGAEVYVGGTQRLTSVWEDLSAVQRILEVLAREAEVMNILAVASGTSIQIGAELPVQDVDLAVVSKSYEAGASGGSVGVIGPMRMNYKRAISAVEEVSRELEDRISAEQD